MGWDCGLNNVNKYNYFKGNQIPEGLVVNRATNFDYGG